MWCRRPPTTTTRHSFGASWAIGGSMAIHRCARWRVWFTGTRSLTRQKLRRRRWRLSCEGVWTQLGIGMDQASLIGPAPAFFARFAGQYRWQLLLLCDDPGAVLRGVNFPFGWRVDIDPVTVL